MPDVLLTLLPIFTALVLLWFGQRWQGKREHRHWLRERRLEAYVAVHLWHLGKIAEIKQFQKSLQDGMEPKLDFFTNQDLDLPARINLVAPEHVRLQVMELSKAWDHIARDADSLVRSGLSNKERNDRLETLISKATSRWNVLAKSLQNAIQT